MTAQPINIREKFKRFQDHWSPRIIAAMNDYHFKLAKVKGEFVWHNHRDTDEVFIVIEGRLTIAFRDRHVTLETGEMLVVPKGEDHKPMAEEECHIMLIEPAGTVNTGEAGSALTAEDGVWI